MSAAELGPPGGTLGLGSLTDRIAPERVVGVPVGEIRSLAYDSRRVGPGALFFAVPGEHTDGHRFVPDAIATGAAAVVVQHELPDAGVPQLVVTNARHALADAADLWFGEPSQQLATIGVTGTNGKTTVATLCAQLLAAGGWRPGLVGTVSLQIGDRLTDNPTRSTTPEALELQELLARMVAAGNDSAVIEASSHGLALGRVRNCRFRAGIITNLTAEHLEFHGSWEAYRDAKALLVEEAPLAVLNRDDPSYPFFHERARDRVVSFGFHPEADLHAGNVEEGRDGSTITMAGPLWSGTIAIPLIGRVNVENALAALALAIGWGIEPEVARGALAAVRGVPGRMQRIEAGQPFTLVVDYAHTPDALEKALRSLRRLTAGRLLVVTGCAAWGDLPKRPAIGHLAAALADAVVIANEDPRDEDPDQINRQVADGARAAGARDGETLWVINDRRAAIAHAIGLARAGDTILLAGKGHERSMLVAGGAIPWNEAEIAAQLLAAAGFVSPAR